MDPSFIQPLERRAIGAATRYNEEIPVIDLSVADVAGAISRACSEWGFFQVINHGVAPEKRERLEKEARSFFGMAVEEKRKVRRSEANPLGYYDSEHTKNVRDWKELFDFNAFDPVLIPANPNPNSTSDDALIRELWSQWPQPHFREPCQEYAAEMVTLSYKLLKLIETSLGLQAEAR